MESIERRAYRLPPNGLPRLESLEAKKMRAHKHGGLLVSVGLSALMVEDRAVAGCNVLDQ